MAVFLVILIQIHRNFKLKDYFKYNKQHHSDK
jgi:hypothetical protein